MFLERPLAALAMAGLLAGVGPVRAQAPAEPEAAPPAGTSSISGRVLGADGPVAGAVVHAYHLSTETSYDSAPTGGSGQFRIEDLPYGYFDVAVETPGGLYVADLVANVPPAGNTTLVMTLTPGDSAVMAPRPFPGSAADPVGVAAVSEKATGREFWRGPKGIAILAGLGGAALLAIASGGSDDEPVASPSSP